MYTYSIHLKLLFDDLLHHKLKKNFSLFIKNNIFFVKDDIIINKLKTLGEFKMGTTDYFYGIV